MSAGPRTPQEALAYFLSRPPSTIRLGLERMVQALAMLGSPERRYPILQVAGTNGKGSTCAFASACLMEHGLRVGRYTSPHLIKVNERIWVSGDDISDHALGTRALEVLERLSAELRDELTYFELGTLVALWHFAQERVEAAVLEVGLGGRLDATTAAEPAVTAVASISLDHTEVLGTTVEAIAGEKAGIFKPGVPAVIGAQRFPPAKAVLVARAAELGAPSFVQGRDFFVEPAGPGLRFRGARWKLEAPTLGLRGAHQRENAGLALAALEQLAEGRWQLTEERLRAGLAGARWPGRLEELGSAPPVVVDGAHNPGGVEALVAALAQLYPGQPVHLVFGVLADKDAARMREQLFPRCASIRLVPLPNPRTARAEDSEPDARRSGAGRVELFQEPEAALDAALAQAREEGGLVLAAGSLVLVGLAQQWAKRRGLK